MFTICGLLCDLWNERTTVHTAQINQSTVLHCATIWACDDWRHRGRHVWRDLTLRHVCGFDTVAVVCDGNLTMTPRKACIAVLCGFRWQRAVPLCRSRLNTKVKDHITQACFKQDRDSFCRLHASERSIIRLIHDTDTNYKLLTKHESLPFERRSLCLLFSSKILPRNPAT